MRGHRLPAPYPPHGTGPGVQERSPARPPGPARQLSTCSTRRQACQADAVPHGPPRRIVRHRRGAPARGCGSDVYADARAGVHLADPLQPAHVLRAAGRQAHDARVPRRPSGAGARSFRPSRPSAERPAQAMPQHSGERPVGHMVTWQELQVRS